MAPAGDDGEGPAVQPVEVDEPPVSEVEYADAVTRHAKYLGIDPEIDAEYMWIAQEALDADVPEGWVTGEGAGEYEGLMYYYNEATGESTWDHPLDEYYREKFKKKKARNAEKAREGRRISRTSGTPAFSSPTRARRGSSSRNPKSGSGTETRDHRRSRRKAEGSNFNPGGEKRESSSNSRANEERHESRSSRHRSSTGSRHKRSDKSRHGQELRGKGEGSRDRSMGRQHSRREGSRTGRDERSSSRQHREASDRIKHDDESGRGHEEEDLNARRRRDQKHRREEDGRDEGELRRRHRDQCRGDKQSGSVHSVRDTSRVSQAPAEGDDRSDGPAVEDAEENAGDWVSVSPGGGSFPQSRGRDGKHGAIPKDVGKTKEVLDELEPSEDFESSLQQSEEGGRHRKRHPTKRHPSELISSAQDVIALSPSIGADPNGRREKDRVWNNSGARGRDGESFDSGASGESYSQGQAETRGGKGAEPAVSGEDLAAPNGIQNIKGRSERDRHCGEDQRSSGKGDIGVRKDSTLYVTTVSASGDHQYPGSGVQTALTTTGPVKDGAKLAELCRANGPSTPSGESDNGVPKRGSREGTRESLGAGRGSSLRNDAGASRRAADNNDLEELDFEDDLRELGGSENDGDGDAGGHEGSSAFASVPGPITEVGPAAEASRGGGDKPRVDEDPRRRDTTRHDDDVRTKDRIQDDKYSHRRGQSATNYEHLDTVQKSRVLPVSETHSVEEDPDDWPEVIENQVSQHGRDSDGRTEISERHQSARPHRNRGGRVEVGRGSRESAFEADLFPPDAATTGSSMGTGANDSRRDEPRDRAGGRRDWDRSEGHAAGENLTDVKEKGWSNRMGRNQEPNVFFERERGSKESPRTVRSSDSRGAGYEGGGSSHRYGEHPGGKSAAFEEARRDLGGSSRGEMQQQQKQRQQQQELQEAAARTRELENKVVNLEAMLASSTSREDQLRGELADAARREGASQEKHTTALAEEQRKAADLDKKLAQAISTISEMAAADAVEKEMGKTLRLELEGTRERLKVTEGTLARKEEEEKLPVAGEAEATRLREKLASKEVELEHQGRVLSEAQRRLAEATTQASESSKEVHRVRDLVERLRLDAAESSSRAATSEAALSQAAIEMSALNHALSRAREEVSSKEAEIAKAAEETNRLRLQLGLEQHKLNDVEDRLLRSKASCDSEVESIRARAAQLQSANAAMEREMHNNQQDCLSRVREADRERDAAMYEAKRAAERAASAESWRVKVSLRADKAEADALALGTELAELRSEMATLRAEKDATVAPYLKRDAELQVQLEAARREVNELTVEVKRLQETHANETVALKDEISRKLPWIAEKAVSEAGRQWRKRAEAETAIVRAERERRLQDLQAAMTEGEARRNDDVAGARVQAERFRTIAERLAAENRSIREELEKYIARDCSRPPSAQRSRGFCVRPHISPGAASSPSRAAVGGGRDSGNDGGFGRRGPSSRGGWERMLHAQVLEQVEAHINALRAQLNHKTTGLGPIGNGGGSYAIGEAGVNSLQVSGRQGPQGPPGDGKTVEPDDRGSEHATAGRAPPSVETRGNYHLSPPLAQRSGNEDGLTEEEDMRLNRLLRSCSTSSSPPPFPGTQITPVARYRGSTNTASGGSDATAGRRATAGDDQGMDFDPFEDVRGVGTSGVSRKLFAGSTTKPLEGACRDREKGSFDASHHIKFLSQEQEDDLEDISDGGFHSGCWRRKYVRGEMR